MLERIRDELSRLLHASFHGDPGHSISKSDLTRMWSLELQWFSPTYSSSLANCLHDSRWLVGEATSLLPNPTIELLPPSLGWQPLLGSLDNIPELTTLPIAQSEQYSSLTVTPTEEKSEDAKENSEIIREAEVSVKALIAHVARKSGLDRREVVRRAQRKRRALDPVTLWMAVALLAREQSLDMHEVMELIEP